MSRRTIVAVGAMRTTALGREVAAAGIPAVEATDRAFDAASASGVMVGLGSDDPVGAALSAVRSGRPVLLEPLARCGADGLRAVERAAIDAGVPAFASFRRRHEPDLVWARGSVAAGAIGLPWGVHAEALRAVAGDALTEALDLLDAVAWASGLRPRSVASLGRPGRTAADRSELPIVMSVAFDHGGVGQVVARTAAVSESLGGQEVASFRITGSHGTIVGDFDGPALDRHPDAGHDQGAGHVRVDASGTRRMLDGFRSVVSGGGSDASLVGLGAAADLFDLMGSAARARRKG